MAVDAKLWDTVRKFGASGPRVQVLTALGRIKSFARGAGLPARQAEALLFLSAYGGSVELEVRRGAKRFPHIGLETFEYAVWFDLEYDGYISWSDDGLSARITPKGVRAVEAGDAESDRLLARVRREHPLDEVSVTAYHARSFRVDG